MDEGKYLSEVSGRLRRAGFTVERQDERLASISLDSQPLCQINGSGGVRRGVQANEHLDAACDRAVDIVRTTAAYMKQMETAPLLEADGLSEDYRLLAEFNGVVLAGHEQESQYGVEFITWEWNNNRSGLWQGHYYDNNYEGAQQDFVERSGLIDQDRLFTNEQLAEIYRCIHETLDSEYPITDSRREILQNACTQIENAVSNLDELVQESNQEELELGASLLAQDPTMRSY